jgi:PAS domain S-box-containing protein
MIAEKSPTDDPGQSKPAVLIIDDDRSNLAIVTDYLKSGDYDILVAEDGRIGIERARFARPDLILLDVLMPGIDGFETCRRLKADAATREIPVIFMTALSDTDNKIKGFAAGAVDYVTKPSQREEVLARVGVHLRIRELATNLQEAKALLENRVEQRTAQLERANQELQAEITERMQAEKALAESKNYLDKIINSISDPISVKDTSRHWVLLNDAACSFIGRERAELLGKCADDVFPEHEARAIREQDRRVLASGRESVMEHTTTAANGTARSIILKKTLYTDERGRQYIVAIIRDITEHKILEEQLRQAVKMEAVGTLAGGVAHDFNNLMTAVMGYSELLLRRIPEENPWRRDIEQISKAGRRAASLTQQLLAFSRKQVAQPKILDINQVIAETEEILKRLIGENIHLVSRPAPLLGRVMADPGLIGQVLMNLALNARDAMPQGGQLTIETANVHLGEAYARHHIDVAPGNYVVLIVSDTGIGMDAETRSHIFEPFFTTKEKGKGTGLGLATVYGIVKQSGGHIWGDSEPGRGATFKVYLPRAEQKSDVAEPDDSPAVSLSGGSETILIVEDDDIVRELVNTTLCLAGYTVLESEDGDKAIELCREQEGRIHLLITDVVMPRMGGCELASLLGPECPMMKVLYISGHSENAIEHHGVMEEGAAFLQKPFTPEALTRKIRQVLDGDSLPGR